MKVKISSETEFSRIVQGFWRLDKWQFSTDELIRYMEQCVERGVTTFDTAEIYAGTLCETLLGEALKKDKGLRNKVQIVSKTGIFQTTVQGKSFGYYDTTYNRVKQSCKESLKRLGTDHLDLYLIHREDPCFNPEETGRALLELKKEGYVKEIGVSNFDPMKFDVLNKAVDHQLVTNQIECNPVCFEHFNSGMMDYLTYHKIHPMIWSPLAGGSLFDPENVAASKAMTKIKEVAERHNVEASTIVYAWLLYHPVGALPIVGSSKIERLEAAIKALEVQLEHHEWYEIYVASGMQVLR